MEVFSWAASAVLGSYSTQGAIDVIAIRKKSGIIDCSPFHVKLSLPSIGKVFSKTVKLRVNGQLVSVSMKLGPAGEAFFIQRTSTIKHHSEPLKCVESNTSSNVMESDSRLPALRGRSYSLGDLDANCQQDVVDMNSVPEPHSSSPAVFMQRVRSKSDFSKSDLSSLSTLSSQLSIQLQNPQSSKKRSASYDSNSVNWSWTWGDLPVKSHLPLPQLLSGTSSDDLSLELIHERLESDCSTCETVNSNQHFPLENARDVQIFSFCGHILCGGEGSPEPKPQSVIELQDILTRYSIPATDLTLERITDPCVVTIVDDFLLPVGVAFILLERVKASIDPLLVASHTLYQYDVTENAVQMAIHEFTTCLSPCIIGNNDVIELRQSSSLPNWTGKRISSWNHTKEPSTISNTLNESIVRLPTKLASIPSHEDFVKLFVEYEETKDIRKESRVLSEAKDEAIACQEEYEDPVQFTTIKCSDGDVDTISLEDIPYDAIAPEPAGGDFYDSDTDSYLSLSLDDGEQDNITKYRFRKVLVPSQEELVQMNLHDGENDVTFEIDGHPILHTQLFVWSEEAKIVVTDIEDALVVTKATRGMLGIFATSSTVFHAGSCDLLNAIVRQGYQILYIAQQSASKKSSKDMLAEICVGSNSSLPPGPVIKSPDSLIRGFGANRTDLFKAAALRGLKGLFPLNHDPYHACFCTRIQDAVVFSRYGVPDGRIFLVSHAGEVHNKNKTFRRTFIELKEDVETIFPQSITGPQSSRFSDDTFSDFNFWRITPALV